jgi:nucleoside-diphosphate-sugar epimerase
LKEVDEVYHCAAKVSFHPKDEKEMYHTNIKGTENSCMPAKAPV